MLAKGRRRHAQSALATWFPSLMMAQANWRYIMSLPQGLAIDASKAGGPARFINHSCQPNCVAQRWQVAGDYRVGIFAAREIQADEEITFSYSNHRGATSSSGDVCHCGAEVCSGHIWQPPKKVAKSKPSQVKGAATSKRHQPAQKACMRNYRRCSATTEAPRTRGDAVEQKATGAWLGKTMEASEALEGRSLEVQDEAPLAQWEEEDWRVSEDFCQAFYCGAGWRHSPEQARQALEQQRLPCCRERAAAGRLGIYLPSALLRVRESPRL